jgi:hypothetical protein
MININNNNVSDKSYTDESKKYGVAVARHTSSSFTTLVLRSVIRHPPPLSAPSSILYNIHLHISRDGDHDETCLPTFSNRMANLSENCAVSV